MCNTDWRQLLLPEVQDFIMMHEEDNIRDLALKKMPNEVLDAPLILDQIKVRQKAKTKAKKLYETDGIIFPPHDLFEQASSTPCAFYKASLVSGATYVDLTAGCGVDAYAFAKRFETGALVEKNMVFSELLDHNFSVLFSDNRAIKIIANEAEGYVDTMQKTDFVFIDPQRRESRRAGLYDFAVCTPNILEMLPVLKKKAKTLMIKASPVLDIEKACNALGCVTEVHVVQWQNECKEVLYICDFTRDAPVPDIVIHAVMLDDDGRVLRRLSYQCQDEKNATCDYAMPQEYIYEPGPAFLKAGGFKTIALQYGLSKLHPHSHLYTSEHHVDHFPGKIYRLKGVKPVKAKGLGVARADVALRNFPGDVKALRKKLKIGDGGDCRIFATTLVDERKKLLLCQKLAR